MKASHFFFLICFLAFFSCGAGSNSQNVSVNSGLSQTAVTIHSSAGDVTVTAEVAQTEAQRSIGLMNRSSLGENAGMLFVFSQDTQSGFWMLNTEIPLDMIFINTNKEIIYIEENTIPFSREIVGPDEPYRYVLEVNAGYTASHNINSGDRVDF